MIIKKRELAFCVSFTLLYISLFMGDIYEVGGLGSLARWIRLASYIFIVISAFNLKMKFNEWVVFAVILIGTLLYGGYTGDLYWSTLVFMIYGAKDIEKNRFFSLGFKILLTGTLIVVCFCFIGVIPDALTVRDTTISNSFQRHSFGFYHSNVLPLVVFYLEAYYVFMKKNCVNILYIMGFGAIAFALYLLCNSRNAFFLSAFFTLSIIIEKNFKVLSKIKNILYLLDTYIVVLMSMFSVAMLYLLLKGGIWDKIDNLFSGRFRLAIFKMRRVGLHLINIMSNDDFVTDNIQYVNGTFFNTLTVDNGYLYVILRYGLLVIFFYIVVAVLLASKAETDSYMLITILMVFVANFIDNDLVDYSFLPFILYTFNGMKIRKGGKNKSLRRIKFIVNRTG